MGRTLRCLLPTLYSVGRNQRSLLSSPGVRQAVGRRQDHLGTCRPGGGYDHSWWRLRPPHWMPPSAISTTPIRWFLSICGKPFTFLLLTAEAAVVLALPWVTPPRGFRQHADIASTDTPPLA